MDYITTTELRTKSKKLVDTLKDGGSVGLIHRSKFVGSFQPVKKKYPGKKFDAKKFSRLVEELNLPGTTYEERDRIYREHIMEKYGKGLS